MPCWGIVNSFICSTSWAHTRTFVRTTHRTAGKFLKMWFAEKRRSYTTRIITLPRWSPMHEGFFKMSCGTGGGSVVPLMTYDDDWTNDHWLRVIALWLPCCPSVRYMQSGVENNLRTNMWYDVYCYSVFTTSNSNVFYILDHYLARGSNLRTTFVR